MLLLYSCNRNETVGKYEKGKKADLFPAPAFSVQRHLVSSQENA